MKLQDDVGGRASKKISSSSSNNISALAAFGIPQASIGSSSQLWLMPERKDGNMLRREEEAFRMSDEFNAIRPRARQRSSALAKMLRQEYREDYKRSAPIGVLTSDVWSPAAAIVAEAEQAADQAGEMLLMNVSRDEAKGFQAGIEGLIQPRTRLTVENVTR